MTYQEIILKSSKAKFENYGSFNEGELQHDILTCTKGKHDGEVIDIYYNFYSGVVKSAEVSTQFINQLPTYIL